MTGRRTALLRGRLHHRGESVRRDAIDGDPVEARDTDVLRYTQTRLLGGADDSRGEQVALRHDGTRTPRGEDRPPGTQALVDELSPAANAGATGYTSRAPESRSAVTGRTIRASSSGAIHPGVLPSP